MQMTYNIQFIYLLASMLLLIAFAMLSQRRILSLINLFCLAGAGVVAQHFCGGLFDGSAPFVLFRRVDAVAQSAGVAVVAASPDPQAEREVDVETLINIPTTMLVGIALVIFAFNLAAPISQLSRASRAPDRHRAGQRVAVAVDDADTAQGRPQVVGFLAMENGLFFAATSATHGMPLVVELGIALDVLVATFIFGIFFFQIRETFDSLDITNMEKLKDD